LKKNSDSSAIISIKNLTSLSILKNVESVEPSLASLDARQAASKSKKTNSYFNMKTASNVELAKSYVPNESSNGATPAGLLV
jgi:hypothetical protein